MYVLKVFRRVRKKNGNYISFEVVQKRHRRNIKRFYIRKKNIINN